MSVPDLLSLKPMVTLTLSKAEKDRLFPAQRKWIKDKDKKVRRGNHEVV